MVGYYLMQNFVTVLVENSDVIIGLERVGCDHHDPSIEMIHVMN